MAQGKIMQVNLFLTFCFNIRLGGGGRAKARGNINQFTGNLKLLYLFFFIGHFKLKKPIFVFHKRQLPFGTVFLKMKELKKKMFFV